MGRRTGTAVACAVLAAITVATQEPQPEPRMSGGISTHTVGRGETLTSISARFGVAIQVLAAHNALEDGARLQVGQTLVIDNRHLVPAASPDAAAVVNVPQRMLFHRGDTVVAMPVAVGRADWKTPLGRFTVVAREVNPTWHVPASIAEEARRAGRPLPASIPPGPDNPLGAYWVGLSGGGIGLHGTNTPASIFRAATHGCLRLHPDDIAWLFARIELGSVVELVYEPVLLAEIDGRVWLEVHADVYRRAPPAAAAVAAEAQAFAYRIDWKKVGEVIARREGVARDVTLDAVMR